MRLAVISALVLLTVGCSTGTGGHPVYATSTAGAGTTIAESSIPTDAPGITSSTTATTVPTVEPPAAPRPGSPLPAVIAWVDAGRPVDTTPYHVGHSPDGTTDLRRDIAFSSPSGKITCVTDEQDSFEGLTCTVDLVNPPPRPQENEGNWIGGWVEYTGVRVGIGSFHGDPGPFIRGKGDALPYGSVIGYRDYRCRMDVDGLTCVNPSTKSGVLMSSAGVVGFGCLHETSAAGDYSGRLFRC